MTPSSPHDAALIPEHFEREWEEWRRQREATLVNPFGFLGVTGLYWLSDTPTTLDDAPGTWTSIDDVVRVDLAEDEWLEVEGVRLTEHYSFAPIAERGGLTVEFDGGVIEIAKRGGRDLLRARRDDAAFLREYSGTPSYRPDPRWRVSASFLPFDEPRPVTVGAAADGIQHVYGAPGQLEFELAGETFRLTAFPGLGGNSLLALFTDATSGVTTYGANRAVTVPAPDDEGRTVIDFNRASNMPCAYTEFATCPLPPAENRLKVAIEAGEKTPTERVHGVVGESAITLEAATETRNRSTHA